MAKNNSTGKQATKKQPGDCHCDEIKNSKAKTAKSAKDCSDCSDNK